jgi:hypothetical protein
VPVAVFNNKSVTADALPFLQLDSLLAVSTAKMEGGVESTVLVSAVLVLVLRAEVCCGGAFRFPAIVAGLGRFARRRCFMVGSSFDTHARAILRLNS